MELIIFTDLDGSLLNHDDYSFAAARSILTRIRESDIPLIFVTSKTRSEVELLQHAMGVQDPFVVENGGGIFFPAGYRGFIIEQGQRLNGYTVVELGVSYSRIRTFLTKFGWRFSIRGFGDLSTGEIAALTDLPEDKVELAKIREFTEPFLAGPDPGMMQAFADVAAQHRLKINQGGRFYHLFGEDQDKGVAVRTCRDIFFRNTGTVPVTVGIGDSENDLPMLAAVDIPVLIPHLDGSSLALDFPGLIKAGMPGAVGWAEVVERILDGCA